jgi:hypothetical protein
MAANIFPITRLRPAGWPRAQVMLAAAVTGVAGSLTLAILCGSLSPVVALLAIVGILVMAGMIASPEFAILVVCLSVPFERIGRLTNDADTVAVSVSRILGVITLASLLLHVALRRKKLRFGWTFGLYAGYVGLAFLSNAWAFTPEETFRDCFRVLGNLLFFFLAWNLIVTYADARRAVLFWLVASMAADAYSLGDYYFSRNNPISEEEMGLTSSRLSSVVSDGAEVRSLGVNVNRLFGTTAHPTLFGLNNTMTLPFYFWAMRVRRGWWRLLFGVGFIGALACIILSNTRAVFLLAAFTLLFCFARKLAKLNVQTVGALIVIGLVAWPLIPKDVLLRSLDPALYTTAKGDSIRVRFKFWEKSWELIQQNWWHGIGLGDQTTLQKMVTDEDTGYLSTMGLKASAHNEYIWVMVELGLGGYLLFWGFVGTVTRASFRAASLFRIRSETRDEYLFMLACQTLLIGVLLFAVQSEEFHYPLKGWWLAAALSSSMLAWARRVREEQRTSELQISELSTREAVGVL